jgi:hypothetical protein
MKKWIVLVVAAFVLVSCNLPFTVSINAASTPVPATPGTTVMVVTATPQVTVEPLATATSEMAGVEKNLGGIYMKIPACLASDASGVIVPEENPGADAPVFAYIPEYRKITLLGYPLSGKLFDPIIQVYPLARFEELAPSIGDTVTQMQQIISTKPVDFQNGIPLLPIENAAHIFHAQTSYIDFQNGSGVGFLTQYAQAFVPINNHELFYAYQGLTNDGKYWVSIFLPVNASFLQASYDDPSLPADGIPMPDLNSNHLDTEYPAYTTAVVQKLNATSVDAFTPTLECIHSFIQTINVGD